MTAGTSQSTAAGHHFSDNVERALRDTELQQRLRLMLGLTNRARNKAIPPGTPTDMARDKGKLIRAEVVAHLDKYLEQFIENATARGIHVHLARTSEDARRIVLEIADKHNVRRVTKGKSMVSEECGIREAMLAEGMEVTETDLGELLVQLAEEPPSHLIGPAIHMNHRRMGEALAKITDDGKPLPPDPQLMMDVTRRWLRSKFLEADMGITGANFGIAETGTFFIVTNEGNGRMTSMLPKVHVAMMGIERLLPTLDSMSTILQLLTRAGTGQWITVYVSMFAGPRKSGELQGPEEQHLVLVDNGRSKLLGTQYAEALECIRCGACLNACPVYEKGGGHLYESVYGGPIGKVVTPLYGSSPIANELPHASTLCSACRDACPIKIDIPRMLVGLRRENKFAGKLGRLENLGVAVASRVLASPALYRMAARLAKPLMGKSHGDTNSHDDGWITRGRGPLAQWTLNRDLPPLARVPFRERWRRKKEGRTG